MSTVFLTIPNGGQVDAATLGSVVACTAKHQVSAPYLPQADKCMAHAACLVAAYRSGCEYWANLHSDVAPSANWIDSLIDELDDCDLVSAVVTMKGVPTHVSTAQDTTPLSWEAIEAMPETFEASGLLWNTGCFVARVGDWMKQIDRFAYSAEIDWSSEKPKITSRPEDHHFAAAVNRAARVRITRKLGRGMHRATATYE